MIIRWLIRLAFPALGALLLLMFFQQFVFATYEQMLPLFDLSRLGLNAAENTPLFLLIGVIAVLVQGKYLGIWSRRWGDHKLVYAALALMAIGMTMIALTPRQAVAWYDRDALLQDLSDAGGTEVVNVEVEIPDGSNTGWLGLGWLVIALIPASVGGAMIRPSVNSLITKRVPPEEIGVMLGVSMALVSAANALTPILGGLMFEYFGASAPFFVSGVLMVLLLFYALQRVKPSSQPVTGTTAAPDAVPAPGGTD
jgi:MFS family permease